MRPILLICIIALSTSCTLPSCRTISGLETDSQPFTHEQWTNLLQKHVSADGWVNYEGFIKDSTQLNNYLQQIESNYPNEKNWSREQILAYWINAYNAYTVQIVIRNYPVASIKDIKPGVAFLNSVWDIKFITIEGEQLDLNNIEHNILRKMNEPRIHFAVNCASYSCPKLLNTAYEAATIDNQLNQQAIDFINDPKRNLITPEEATVSSIFNWFTGDFTNNGSLKDFLNKYSNVPIAENTSINFMEYNWNLNKQ
ncbi:MAG TPA: DUF547 domain-containing protein [Chitinophagales bacterium]|nr:DUF547 domain-containing protein [Chitinophagales bacterium]HRG84787.1 DUF547 domain-containing protein [Chitinophagales bacterium]